MTRFLTLALALLAATSVHAQEIPKFDWKPYAVLVAGQGSDLVTTLHILRTPQLGCQEANPLMGAQPSSMKLIVPKLAIVGGIALVMRLAHTKGSPKVEKVVGYLAGGVGGTLGFVNVKNCGW